MNIYKPEIGKKTKKRNCRELNLRYFIYFVFPPFDCLRELITLRFLGLLKYLPVQRRVVRFITFRFKSERHLYGHEKKYDEKIKTQTGVLFFLLGLISLLFVCTCFTDSFPPRFIIMLCVYSVRAPRRTSPPETFHSFLFSQTPYIYEHLYVVDKSTVERHTHTHIHTHNYTYICI